MKVFSKIEIKKTRTNSFHNPVLTYILLSLILLSLFILLTACDSRTTSSTAAATTLAARNIPAASPATKPQASASEPAGLTTRLDDQTGLITAGTGNSPVAISNHPAIRFSPETARVGETIEITGSGYPANTRLNIQLAAADFKTIEIYATVLSDETGRFKTSLKLEGRTQNGFLAPGKLEIAVTTPDNRLGASAPLALQPSSNTSPDEASMNLVQEFFSTLKRDPQSAQVYLTTGLRGEISSGNASLPGLLGLQNPPLRAEIARVQGSKNIYQATMFFSSGEHKLVELDVTTDVSGALKIAAIRAK